MNDISSSQVGTFVGIIVLGVIPIVSLVWTMTRSSKREITPQPLQVKAADTFALRDHSHSEYITRQDCITQHKAEEIRLDRRFAEIRLDLFNITEKLDEHNKQAEARASSIHDRIDPIARETASTRDRLADHLQDHRSKEG